MGVIGTIFLICLLAFIFTRYSGKLNLSTKEILIGWFISVSIGCLYLYIFKFHFGGGSLYGDSKNFVQDGLILGDLARENPIQFLKLLIGIDSNNLELLNNELAETNIWSYGDNGDFINDNRLIIKINALISLFSGGNLWIHSVVFCGIFYTGILLLYQSFKTYCSRQKLLFYGLLLFPTISFWGNGITKESVLILAMGLYFYSVIKFINSQWNWKTIVTILLAVSLLAFNKPHVGITLLFFSWIFLFVRRTQFGWKQLGIISSITLFFAISFSYTPNRVNLVDRISFKQKELINLGEGGVFFINDSSFCAFDYKDNSKFTYYKDANQLTIDQDVSGEYKLFGDTIFHEFSAFSSQKRYDVYHIIPPSSSIVPVNRINYSGIQLIKNAPQALTNVLIRPFPWDPGDQLKIVSFIENILFILFFVYVMWNRKESLNKNERIIITYLFFAATALLLIIGWTTPILGAIVRYKMAPLLLIFIALACFIKPLKINYENN
jgi:hypothetical protein